VTLADEADPARIEGALMALAGYRVDATFSRVHLLREGPGRVWAPIADALFAAPAVVGRGGLPVELTVSERPDPDAAALPGASVPLVVTARVGGAVAGYAEGWCRHGAAQLTSLVLVDDHLYLDVGRHLVAAFSSEAAGRGCSEVTLAPGLRQRADLG
jgi:hypothetical protein